MKIKSAVLDLSLCGPKQFTYILVIAEEVKPSSLKILRVTSILIFPENSSLMQKEDKIYRLYFQICRCWGLSLSPYSAQFCTLALHQVPVRFICLLACGVSCPRVSCMNNSWRSKAFAENSHEQLLAQILPSILYPVPITIIAPKLPSRSGSSYKYL